ncbi:Wzz/FepE/Etk N-terminal domain-containing protein [Bombilactobacillus folatiphilus]|uniref:Capsular polysaccharide biosynthesis protein CpsC n=1 Tax=Bombilactobacillus folatiphilus TaxID=2923362 RepID=A0ABY4P7V5_9LACO|nr:Wzz/FepE/Etk N-terminal domain-containing protein [Bombilactobacillus folatiphilus]UQS81722.1 Wzz/FepE/Etk N-terminal domain-containing protein [Bombilactobacillus folatiphilus]
MKQTFSLLNVWHVLRKHWQTILYCLILGLGGAVILVFAVLKPQYQAQTQVVASLSSKTAQNNDEINNNLQLLNTYKEFVVSDIVLEDSAQDLQQLGLDRKASELKKSIKVVQSQNSLMLTIKVTDANRYASSMIANVLTKVFQTKIKHYFHGDKILIVSKAQVPHHTAQPRRMLLIVLGGVLGTIVGLLLSLVLELTDRTVKDEYFIKNDLDLPIIGRIGAISSKQMQSSIAQNSLAEDEEKQDLAAVGRDKR